MGFNDFITLSDRDYAVMKQKYDKILENETNDLQEILTKMLDQKSNLEKINMDGRYDSVISKLNGNIDELNRLISNNNSNILYKSKVAEIPHIKGLIVDSSGTAITPVRGKMEMENHANMSTPIDPNMGNRNLDNVETPISPIRQNTNKRNSPMQSSFVSNIIKQFTLNKRKKIVTNEPKNRFHNIITLHKKCEPHNILLGSQIDIIRLLLLYLTLRPNCKYLSRLATIANDQFDIYLNLESEQH